MYCGHARLCVCVCVCLSAAIRRHYCTDPDVTWGHGRGCPLFVHCWADLQSGHGLRCYGNNANPSSKLASIPRYDGVVRTAGWAGSARVAGGRRATGDAPKTARRIRQAGRPARQRLATDWERSQHYCGSLECGPSNGGVLAIKSERKMLASTCLYSLYAWF